MAIFICIILILIFTLLLYISDLKFEIVNLDIDNINEYEKIVNNYEFIIGFSILDKLTWARIRINKNKIEKLKKKKIHNRINKVLKKRIQERLKKIKNINLKNRKDILFAYKKLNLIIENINLDFKYGTNNVVLTSFLYVIFITIISGVLSNPIKEYRKENYIYKIKPMYKNKNFYDLTLNCIISVKIAHIINVIFNIKRSDKLYARTSNRKFNGNSNEQYSGIG